VAPGLQSEKVRSGMEEESLAILATWVTEMEWRGAMP